jgi:hypothetical protein
LIEAGATHLKHGLAANHRRVSQPQGAEFRIPQTGKKQALDDDLIQPGSRLAVGGDALGLLTNKAEQVFDLVDREEHVPCDFPGRSFHAHFQSVLLNYDST